MLPYNEKILNYDTYYFFIGSTFLSDIHLLAKYLEQNGKEVINTIHIKESVISKTLFYSIINKYNKNSRIFENIFNREHRICNK